MTSAPCRTPGADELLPHGCPRRTGDPRLASRAPTSRRCRGNRDDRRRAVAVGGAPAVCGERPAGDRLDAACGYPQGCMPGLRRPPHRRGHAVPRRRARGRRGGGGLWQYLFDHGSDGLVIAGTTGEATTLTDEEHVGLVALACRRWATREHRRRRRLQRHAPRVRADRAGHRRRRRRGPRRSRPYYNKPNRARHPRPLPRGRARAPTSRSCSTTSRRAPRSTCRPTCWPSSAQIEDIEAVKQANDDDLQPIDGLNVYAGNDDDAGARSSTSAAPAACSWPATWSAARCGAWSTSPSAAPRSTRRCRTSTRPCSSPPARPRARPR